MLLDGPQFQTFRSFCFHQPRGILWKEYEGKEVQCQPNKILAASSRSGKGSAPKGCIVLKNSHVTRQHIWHAILYSLDMAVILCVTITRRGCSSSTYYRWKQSMCTFRARFKGCLRRQCLPSLAPIRWLTPVPWGFWWAKWNRWLRLGLLISDDG